MIERIRRSVLLAEGLLGLSSEAQQQAAHASLEAIARLAQSQVSPQHSTRDHS